MTARLTDEQLDELERECLTPGPVSERLFIHRAMLMSEALPSLLAEVRELRAYNAQVERVKSCSGCLGIGVETDPDGYFLGKCAECGGLP